MSGRGLTNKFNRGEIDPNALSREDVTRIHNSSELMENFIPMRLGPMQYRPGTQYLGAVAGEAHCIPFVRAIDDRAVLEFTNNVLRIWADDILVTRTAVTTTVTNGTFDADLASWTDAGGAGSTSVWVTGGYMGMTGSGSTSAVRHQTLTTETGAEHGIRIVILQAPVTLKLGTGGANSSDIFSGELDPGTHSLVFTPASNVTVTLSSSREYQALVDSVAIEAAGAMSLPIDVATASLPSLRHAQSADIVDFAYASGAQFRVERRGVKSWSTVDFRANDGPFDLINTTSITMAAGALTGNTTLTASESYFTTNHVDMLFRLGSEGQTVTDATSGADDGTGNIRVDGVGGVRAFTVQITGTFVATITLQRSADEATWEDITTYAAPTTVTYNDSLDNALLYYRLWIKTTDWTSGTANLTLVYSSGSIEGICRTTAYTSPTVMQVQVLSDFGATDATDDWYKGSWSDVAGHPTSTGFYESRRWCSGKAKIWGSVSDAYQSYDRTIEGNSASIQKTIGFGPVDTVQWLAPSSRLIMGIASDEIAVRSSAFGEVVTQANCNLKSGSSQGSANIQAIAADDYVYFVQRSGKKIYLLSYALDRDRHAASDLNMYNADICSAGIKRIALTHQPETRLWVVLDNGEMRVYTLELSEDVSAWSRVTMDEDIEDVVVLPCTLEDRVYVVVNRAGGRYLEKFARFDEALGGATSKHLDSFKQYTSPGATITDLGHLEGETVKIWADGQDRGTETVSGGQVPGNIGWINVIVGLGHTANYKSNKLAKFQPGIALNTIKRVINTGLTLRNYWPGSLKVGPSTANLDDMPLIENGKAVDATATITDYDEIPFEFDGDSDTDSRVYMRATGPVTVMALTYDIDAEGQDDDKAEA